MRRVAQRRIFFSPRFQALTLPATQAGVVVDYHRFKPAHISTLANKLQQRTPEERWLVPQPSSEMVLPKEPGVVVVHGFIRVPQDGLYFFTPARSSYGGGIEAGSVQLYLVDQLVARRDSIEHRRPLALAAGLHPFRLTKTVDKSLSTANLQLLLSPDRHPQLAKALPIEALFRPATVDQAIAWTGVRPDKQAREEAAFMESLEDLDAGKSSSGKLEDLLDF